MNKQNMIAVAAVAVVAMGAWYFFNRPARPETPETGTAVPDGPNDDMRLTIQALTAARAANKINLGYYTEVMRAVMAGTANNAAVREYLAGREYLAVL